MRIEVRKDYEEASRLAAEVLAGVIREKPDGVLGLATGSTPEGAYRVLVRLYEEGRLDFSRLHTVNLDEYQGLAPTHPQSYRAFMQAHLFDHVNIRPENTYVPDGLCADPAAEGRAYDARIEALGGIDLQLLGVGQNGHIGFNEPGESLIAPTHLTPLTDSTITANARFFDGRADVPTHALTMGMASIMRARRILLMMCGKNKHAAYRALLDDRITTQWPVTLLKMHPDVLVICDREAMEG